MGQPPDTQLQDRPHLLEGIEEFQRVAERIRTGQSGDGRRIDGVDSGEGPRRLVGEGRSGHGVLLVAQDASGDGLSFEPFDDKPPGVEAVGRPGGHHLRHRNPGPVGDAEQIGLGLGVRTSGQACPLTCCRMRARACPEGVARSKELSDPRRPTRKPAHRRHPTAEGGS